MAVTQDNFNKNKEHATKALAFLYSEHQVGEEFSFNAETLPVPNSTSTRLARLWESIGVLSRTIVLFDPNGRFGRRSLWTLLVPHDEALRRTLDYLTTRALPQYEPKTKRVVDGTPEIERARKLVAEARALGPDRAAMGERLEKLREIADGLGIKFDPHKALDAFESEIDIPADRPDLVGVVAVLPLIDFLEYRAKSAPHGESL